MPPLPRSLRTVLACGLAGAAAFGCGHERVEESIVEELRFDSGGRTVVEVRVDDGRVDVLAGDPGVVEVVFKKFARAADSAGADSLIETVTTEAIRDGDVVRVRARARTSGAMTLGGHAWTDVTIRMPAESSELDILTEDGRIEIAGVSATIRAESGDGRIRVSDVGGNVRLRTNDGSITGTDLEGDFDVLTDDGRIRLEGSFGQLRAVSGDGSIRVTGRDMTALTSEWSLRTSDGEIELSLPQALAFDLDASSGDGRIEHDLSRFQGTESQNRIHGRIGPGGPRILVTTMDGRIVIRER